MGRNYDGIDGRLAAWLVAQPVFFVATAPADPGGLLDCSPEGNRGEVAGIDESTVA